MATGLLYRLYFTDMADLPLPIYSYPLYISGSADSGTRKPKCTAIADVTRTDSRTIAQVKMGLGWCRIWRKGVDGRYRMGMHAPDRPVPSCKFTHPPPPFKRLILHCFLLNYLNCFCSDWRRPQNPSNTQAYATYVQILTWFFDTPSTLAPFSVHRMALAGKDLGKDVGTWFGPSTAAGSIKFVFSIRPPVTYLTRSSSGHSSMPFQRRSWQYQRHRTA